jgi:hypothetical protein
MALLQNGSQGPRVRRLQESLRSLGYLDDEPDGDFGPRTEDAVRDFQADNGLNDDGIVGTLTQDAIDGEIATALRHAERERDTALLDVDSDADQSGSWWSDDDTDTGTDTVTDDTTDATSTGDTGTGDLGLGDFTDSDGGDDEPAGAARSSPAGDTAVIMSAAADEWNSVVKEPPGSGWERIDTYIRSADGLGWDWEDRYTRNRQFAWCGAFASYCYRQAGLSAEVRKKVMPSTFRLHKWANGTDRMRPIDDVQRGDIVIVGPEGGKRWGAHITLCDSVDRSTKIVSTIEGNASGTGPDGDRYEGVIRQERPFPDSSLPPKKYRVMHVIRPLAEDYD